MSTKPLVRRGTAIAIASLLAGCATWHEMDRSEKGTAAGATGGALVGGAIGGPVGAAIGAGAGGYVGHHQGLGEPATAQTGENGSAGNVSGSSANAASTGTASASTRPYTADRHVAGSAVSPTTPSPSVMRDHELIRSVQKALNDKGYEAGALDGLWGPQTEGALQRFQQAQGISQSNGLDDRTLEALGVSSTSMASSREDENVSPSGNATASENASPTANSGNAAPSSGTANANVTANGNASTSPTPTTRLPNNDATSANGT